MNHIIRNYELHGRGAAEDWPQMDIFIDMLSHSRFHSSNYNFAALVGKKDLLNIQIYRVERIPS